MSTLRHPMRFSALLVALVVALVATSPAWAGGRHHGYGDRWSVGIGLNFGYPGPYPGGYYGPPYRYYPAYPYAYGPAYGGRIGIGYRSGFGSGWYDGFGVSLSLPLYFGPRYAPPQPVLVPAPQPRVVTREVYSDCAPTREYQTEIVVAGEVVPAWGTACLQADGSWRVLSGPFAER